MGIDKIIKKKLSHLNISILPFMQVWIFYYIKKEMSPSSIISLCADIIYRKEESDEGQEGEIMF